MSPTRGGWSLYRPPMVPSTLNLDPPQIKKKKSQDGITWIHEVASSWSLLGVGDTPRYGKKWAATYGSLESLIQGPGSLFLLIYFLN